MPNALRKLRRGPKPFHRLRAARLFEALERRTVLDGVTCDLADGVLTIRGTDQADLIGVRIDPECGMVEVRAADRIVDEFMPHEIHRVDILGLQGDDVFEIDAAFSLPVLFDGGEGEDSMIPQTASAHDRMFEQFQVEDVEQPGETLLGLLSVSAPPTAPIFASTMPGNANGHAASHAATDMSVPANNSSASAFAGIASASIGSASTLAAALQGHGHIAAITTPSTSAALPSALDQGSAESQQRETKAVEHHGGSPSLDPKGKASTEFVKKWCTTTPWAKQLVASLDGKPKCSCKEQSSRLTPSEGAALVADLPILPAALNAESVEFCRPCEQISLLALPGALSGGNNCSLSPSGHQSDFAMAVPSGQPNVATCSMSRVKPPIEDTFGENLEWAGWSVLAISAALLPLSFERKRERRRQFDWLQQPYAFFPGKLGIENLVTS